MKEYAELLASYFFHISYVASVKQLLFFFVYFLKMALCCSIHQQKKTATNAKTLRATNCDYSLSQNNRRIRLVAEPTRPTHLKQAFTAPLVQVPLRSGPATL